MEIFQKKASEIKAVQDSYRQKLDDLQIKQQRVIQKVNDAGGMRKSSFYITKWIKNIFN